MTQQPSLSDMAGAIGLVLKPDDPAYSASVGSTTVNPEVEAELNLDEFMDEPISNPELHRSVPAFYNSGWAKALLVGSASLGVCLSGAAIFKVSTPKSRVATPPQQDEKTGDDPNQSALEDAQLSASQTTAQLALQTQQRDMAQLVEAEFSDDKASISDKATKAKTPIPAAKPLSKSASTVTVKPASSPPAPLVKPTLIPQSSPQKVVAAPTIQPVVQRPTSQTVPSNRAASPILSDVDPMAEWQRLASLGSYGTVDASITTTPSRLVQNMESDAPAPVNAETPTAVETPSPEPTASIFASAPGFGHGAGDVFEPNAPREPEQVATKQTSDKTKLAASAPAAPLSDYFAGASTVLPIDEEQGRSSISQAASAARTLLVGSSVQGETVTPILWAPDTADTAARFVIQLAEALTDSQGNLALPTGTQLIVQARSIDPTSGLADLEVVSVLINGAEFSPPAGALSVRDEVGGLLIGQNLRSRSGQSAGHDIWRIAAGALGQAGALMNQPRRTSRSSISTSSGSSFSESSQRDDPNYLGAALEGGFEALSDVMDKRQQVAAQELANAPQLYHLPAGHPIRIFVNQSLSF